MKKSGPATAKIQKKSKNWKFQKKGVCYVALTSSLPRWTDGRGRAAAFNRRYERLEEGWRRHCARALLREQLKAHRDAAPEEPLRVELAYETTYEKDGLLSMLITQRIHERTPLCLSSADTWELEGGRLIRLGEARPDWNLAQRRQRRRALKARGDEANADWAAVPRRLLKRHLNTDEYGLSPSGVTFYYPQATIAPPARGLAPFGVADQSSGLTV